MGCQATGDERFSVGQSFGAFQNMCSTRQRRFDTALLAGGTVNARAVGIAIVDGEIVKKSIIWPVHADNKRLR